MANSQPQKDQVQGAQQKGQKPAAFAPASRSNTLPEGWVEVSLGEVATFQRGFDLPKKDRTDGQYPLMVSNGQDGTHKEYKVEGPGIVTGRSGSIGNVYFQKKNFWPLNTTLWIKDFHGNDIKFIYYFLKTFPFDKYNAGSGVPTLNRNHIHAVSIFFPKDVEKQKAIAAALSAFDSKIELLREQNETLEKIGETVFKEWFTDKEHSVTSLEELIIFNPKEKIAYKDEYLFFDMKCLSTNSMILSEGVRKVAKSGSSFRKGDTLLAKITPCLENGKTGFVLDLKNEDIARGSTEFIVMRARGNCSPYFVYCLARNSLFRDYAIKSMTGTSGRQRIQMDLLKKYKVTFSETSMKKFDQKIKPLFEKIKNNSEQIQALAKTRDTLLPRLMKGEVLLNNDRNVN